MNDTIRPTRYAELGFVCDNGFMSPDIWRFVDTSTQSRVGPHYRTKSELLADLERYATQFGCNGAAASARPVDSRIKQLAEEVYWQVFQLLDSEIEYSGDDAGKIATAVERAFLAAAAS